MRWMSEAGVYAFNYTVGIHEYIYIYPGKDSRRLRNAIELTARYRVELPSDVLLSSTSSSPAACLSFIPDIWTTNRRLARASLRGTLRDVLKASVNTVLLVALWTLLLSNGQLNPPFGGSVKGQRLNGNVGESRETVYRPTPD